MKRRFAVTLALLCILSLLSGCADVTLPANTTAPQDRDDPKPRTTTAPETEPVQNTMTAEEVAQEFMQAYIECDSERFSPCVHPNMLDFMIDAYDIWRDSDSLVTEIHTGQIKSVDKEYLEEEGLWDLYSEYGIQPEEAQIITVYVKYYDYSTTSEASEVEDINLFKVDGTWYAFGWS